MRRASLSTLGFTLAVLLAAETPLRADPVAINAGTITVSGVQDFNSRGFLRSISYDFLVDDLRISGSDPDFIIQRVLEPMLPRVAQSMSPDGTVEVVFLNLPRFSVTATPGLAPSPFSLTGHLTVVDLAGETLFDEDVYGSGTATWRFVTAPSGQPIVSGVTYEFVPTPEPGTLILIGSGFVGLAARRCRARNTR